MRNSLIKSTTIFTLLFFAFAQITFAQSSATSTASTTDLVVDVAPVDSTEQGSTTIPVIIPNDEVQDTTTTQTTISGDSLEATINPNTETEIVETPIAPDPNQGKTKEQIDAEYQAEQKAVQDAILKAQEDRAIQLQAEKDNPIAGEQTDQPKETVATFSKKALKPKPDHSFSVNAAKIPTKKKTKIHSEDNEISNATVTTDLSLSADNATGTLNLSGKCSDKYFTVLLYKNKDDYDSNPGMFIVNRAFPCVNGTYSYSLSDIPKTIPEGTYYLLVGQQGETGTWVPITSLSPVDIIRNNN